MLNKWNYKKLNIDEQNEIIKKIKHYYIEENKPDVEIANVLNCTLSFEQYLRRSNNINHIKNIKTIISPLELDIYISKYKVAIL